MSIAKQSRSSVLRSLVGAYKGQVALLSAASLVGALLEAAFLVIVTGIAMALVGDSSTVGPVLGHRFGIGPALASAAVLIGLRLLFSLVSVASSSRLTANVTRDQRELLTHSYLKSNWSVQQAEPAGRLQELLTSFVTRVTQSMQMFSNAVTALLSLLAFLLTGLLVDPQSTGALLVALALVGATLTPIRRRIRKKAQASAKANLEFAGAVAEYGALGLEMQTYGVRDHFIEAIDGLTQDTALIQERVQRLVSALAPIYNTMAYSAVLAGVSLLAWAGFDNLDVIGAVMLLMLRSLSYGQQLASASGTLSANVPFLERVRETIKAYDAAPARTGTTVPGEVHPVTFHDVSFAYAFGPIALSQADFSLARGEVLGVIGPSGAGKSTLAHLLLGLREPTGGLVTTGAVDLRDVDRAWWAHQVAFVAQDVHLLSGTVAENIRFFRPGIDICTMRQAAERANILADIEAMSEGFETHIGERGGNISGGQRQRISLARALAGRPNFLVLDEPTSALDSHSESLIRSTLADLRGSITIVIIAHRMSTLDICDRILVVEDGVVTSLDSPERLRANNAFYRRALAAAGITEGA